MASATTLPALERPASGAGRGLEVPATGRFRRQQYLLACTWEVYLALDRHERHVVTGTVESAIAEIPLEVS